MEKQSEWRLHGGHYLGEISALCFLHLPPLPHLSSLPYLLAGTGSQVLLYDLESVAILRSFHVLEGIRVHGIACGLVYCKEGSLLSVKIAVFGERRVKLFNLRIEIGPDSRVCFELTLLQSLPKFSHWVLDVCFFKEDIATSSQCLVVGCSDNSVHLWDMLTSNLILEVRNPERCLLYSMRFWGDELQNLLVASGTIYNEIIVWKAVLQNCTSSLGSSVKDHINSSGAFCNGFNHYNQQYQALKICRLAGHEGSIFRLAWSSNGSKLVSVSDDRSARIWPIHAEREVSDISGETVDKRSVGPVLFGHNARIWDCCILDALIVTAGEDCTCRVWGTDGKQLKMIKEHIGRGVWRCLYDPKFSLLVTAGFDSAIKVHQLQASLPKASQEQAAEVTTEFIDRAAIFTACIPKSSEHTGLMDSKSEYVRSLCFTSEDSLYVATNHGYLYHAKLFDTGDVKWTRLIHVSEEVPIVCMDLLSRDGPKFSSVVEDWVAVGDGKGNMTVTRVVCDLCTPKVGVTYTWPAGIERQLLGTFWCKSLGYRYIFTADPRGKLKLWRFCNPPKSASQNSVASNNVSLIAEFISCFNIRIMCLDASTEEEVLVCGDLRGNLVLYPLLRSILVGSCFESEVKITPLTNFKGAHGISSVSSISIPGSVSNQIEIRSTGGDGCVCYFEYGRDQQKLQFVGMKRVKELSLVQSVSSGANSIDDLMSSKYAIGFASTDFIIWNLMTETKVVQVPCGGWRRPHSYFLGDVPEMRNCFAYVKDEIIYIHRFWIPESERKIFPQNLHIQFHGREIHSLCFVSWDLQAGLNGKHDLSSRSSWIATGCEDGTVRLTRYSSGVENWFSSQLLGEHVGGSAVRSICPVSEIHTIPADVIHISNGTERQPATWDDRENPFFLISVGAKRVITSWVLRTFMIDDKGEASDGVQDRPGKGSPSMSFQWLSTDMPTKYSGICKKAEDLENIVGTTKASSVTIDPESRSLFPERKEMQLRTCTGDKYENDWRYLAVTAFLVKDPVSRITVCFMVIGCSDATLSLRALILPSRLWFDVALLVPQSSPVLALQHAVIPIFQPSEDNIQIGNAYIAISGSTDGSIAFWDLTESVENFMLRASTLHTENSIDCQRRPRTGRGSQGGRWWRSLGPTPKKEPIKSSVSMRVEEGTSFLNDVACGTSSKLNDPANTPTGSSQAIFTASLESEVNTDDSSSEICEISPLHVLSSVHQSGVNCLHISDINHCQRYNNGFLYNLVSGGDDQALHCLGFDLTLRPTSSESQIKAVNVENPTKFEDTKNLNHCKLNKNYRIRFLYHDLVASAHNSAVKGIWTDGMWVFSTGLDQRVRCWYLGEHGKLSEQGHLVISVPEPEALDARACGKNHYQIAVAGRGMQMVEISVSSDMDGRDADSFC